MALLLLAGMIPAAADAPSIDRWRAEWPLTDFTRHAVALEEILPGGPPRDGIPALTAPIFLPVSSAASLDAREPVIVLEIGRVARAYPLRVLMWHEMVNDELDGMPILVTYCPLCNASIVYERRLEVNGKVVVLEFGVSGKLRHSDMIM